MIKKIFSPILRTYNDDLSKRWRIEWNVPAPGGKIVRCKNPIYISGSTIEERYNNASEKIKGLRFDLPKSVDKNIFDNVFEFKYEWAKKTKLNYRIVVNNYLKWLGKRQPQDIKKKDFPQYLVWLKENGHSNNNIAKYRDTIYTFYEYAIQLKLISDNPVTKETKKKYHKQSLMYFTDAQISQFKNSDIDAQTWLAIQILYYAFIRPGEMRHMRISWINFENRFIEIPAEFSKNRKTQKVSIPDQLYCTLKSFENYPNSYYILSKNGSPGTDQISEKWLNYRHRQILDTLKIRGRYAFYSWKHTGVVKAVKAGINIKDLQLQLRHHSLDMVNEYLKNLGVMDSEDIRHKFPTL